jgi:hypothetical protein
MEQTRLVSEIADTVLAPILQRQREQMDHITKSIAAELSTSMLPIISVPTINFPVPTWNLSTSSFVALAPPSGAETLDASEQSSKDGKTNDR